MKTILALVLGLMSTVAAAAPISEATPQQEKNWHQWRGPNANGVAPLGNPPIHWAEGQNIRWKVKIPGKSTATPVVWGDEIFLITAIPTDRTVELEPLPPGTPKAPFKIERPNNFWQFVVMCVNRRTGETKWQHTAKEEVPHEGHHPDASYASASPMTDGKNLYVSFGSRGVYCYDLAGNQKWSRDLGRMTIYNSFGEGSSPVVHGDSVIVNWDHQGGSFIVSLDAATGANKWKVDRDENTSWATPLVVEFEGRTQLIVHGSKRVRSYDITNGDLIWECGGQVLAAIPCPVTDGKLVFAMTGYTGNALYAIPLDSKGDITGTDKVAWTLKQGTPYVPSPLLYGEQLYFTASNSGILTCLNATNGEVLIERQRLQDMKKIYASPVGAADRVYLLSREGTALVIKRGAPLEVLATNKLDDTFDASPVVVGKELILRGNEHLYSIVEE